MEIQRDAERDAPKDMETVANITHCDYIVIKKKESTATVAIISIKAHFRIDLTDCYAAAICINHFMEFFSFVASLLFLLWILQYVIT